MPKCHGLQSSYIFFGGVILLRCAFLLGGVSSFFFYESEIKFVILGQSQKIICVVHLDCKTIFYYRQSTNMVNLNEIFFLLF